MLVPGETMRPRPPYVEERDGHPRAAVFKVHTAGNTRVRTGSLALGSRLIQTPVLWLGHSLKSHVRLTSRGDPEAAAPILLNFAELRGNSAALGRSRTQGLHRAFQHDGPILLDSGGYQFQKAASIDLCPHDLAAFYGQSGADIAVALDHPLSPAASRTTNTRRWRRSLENLAAMRRDSAPYLLMPVVHGYTIGQIRRCCERIEAAVGTPCAVGIGSMVPLLKASHIGGCFRYRREDGSIGSQVDFIADAIGTVRDVFPNSLLHVFGAGGVPTVLALFAAGADSCDSAAWRLKASYGAIQLPGTSDRFLQDRQRTPGRVRRVVDAKDLAAIGACRCPACSPLKTVVSRRALLNRSFSARAVHNAHVVTTEIGLLRTAVGAARDHEWVTARMAPTHRLRRLVLLAPRSPETERHS